MNRFRAETSRNDRKGGVINNKSPTSMNLGFKRLKSQKLGFSLYQNNSHSRSAEADLSGNFRNKFIKIIKMVRYK